MSLTELCKLSNFQYIFVKLVVVADREDDLIQAFQLLNVMGCNIPQLDPATETRAKRSMTDTADKMCD